MVVTPLAFQVGSVCVYSHVNQKTEIKSLICLAKLYEVPAKELGLINGEIESCKRKRGEWRERGSRENGEDES